MKKLLCLILLFFMPSISFAADATVNCSSAATVQTAVNARVSGETLTCTAGGTWTSSVTIPSTMGITFNGGGYTITRGSIANNTGMIIVQTNTTTPTRITNFNFANSTSVDGYTIDISGSPTNTNFLIDNNTFTDNGTGCNTESAGYTIGTFINISSQQYGVIFKNTFYGASNAEMIHNFGYGSGDETGWKDNVVQNAQLYIEGNTFTNNCMYKSGSTYYYTGNSAVQNYYGSRIVFRYNTLVMSQIDVHGTPGMIGGRWWEIYNNSFSTPGEDYNQSDFIDLRAGSGVVFNNTASGYAGNIELHEEDSGTPLLDCQVGTGKIVGGNFTSVPAYLWNNTGFGSIGSSTPSIVRLNTDFFLSTKSGYTAYTCPHPSTGLTGTCNTTAGTGGYNIGSTSDSYSWGAVASATETNKLTFTDKWTCSAGCYFAGSDEDDTEKIMLAGGAYAYLTNCVPATATAGVTLKKDQYDSGGTYKLYYRTAATQALCEGDGAWTEYTTKFTSSGWVRLCVAKSDVCPSSW